MSPAHPDTIEKMTILSGGKVYINIDGDRVKEYPEDPVNELDEGKARRLIDIFGDRTFDVFFHIPEWLYSILGINAMEMEVFVNNKFVGGQTVYKRNLSDTLRIDGSSYSHSHGVQGPRSITVCFSTVQENTDEHNKRRSASTSLASRRQFKMSKALEHIKSR